MKPVSIIGGGLSGLSLAGALQRAGVETTLYETRAYPQHKVCGEFICGVNEEVLGSLELNHIITSSIHHSKMKWYMGDSLIAKSKMPKTAWGISRYELDQFLAHRFQKDGGTLIKEKRTIENREGVVLGCGKGKNSAKKWIGLKVHLTQVPEEWKNGLQMYVGNAGYVGLCAVDESRVNLCGLFLVNPSVKGKGSELLRNYIQEIGLSALAEQMIECEKDENSFSAVAGFSLGPQSKNGNFQLGDASYLIPPFTGNGMSMAIESAYLASQTLLRYCRGELDWSQSCVLYNQKFQVQFKKRARLAQIIHPVLFSPLGRASLTGLARTNLLPIQTLFTQLRTP